MQKDLSQRVWTAEGVLKPELMHTAQPPWRIHVKGHPFHKEVECHLEGWQSVSWTWNVLPLISRSWVQTLVGSNLGCVVLLSNSYLNKKNIFHLFLKQLKPYNLLQYESAFRSAPFVQSIYRCYQRRCWHIAHTRWWIHDQGVSSTRRAADLCFLLCWMGLNSWSMWRLVSRENHHVGDR